MTTQIYPQGRSRSNSLQRMLDLEKQLMFQRAHPEVKPHAPPPVAYNGSLPTSPTTQQRRFELSPRREARMAPVPVRSYSAVPSPLVINGVAANSNAPAPIHRKQVRSESNAPHEASTSAMTPEKPAQKTVAFVFPPEVEEVRSICQSPSWEAYGRRKKEKEEVKRETRDERKRKEQALKEQALKEQALKKQALEDAKPRGRRLSKAPPPSPIIARALGDRSMTDSMVPVRQIKPKPRPSSVLGIPLPKKAEEPEKPEKSKRKRSGSLTSVIRASFEIRRSSIDRDTGFIGGVKLEQKKQDFHQQVVEDQAKGNSKAPQSPTRGQDSKRRACPPIAINATAARNPGLLTPTSPSARRPSFTNIYLWSARANKGTQSNDECAIVDDSEDQNERRNVKSPPAEQPQQHKEKGLARSGGIYVKSSPPPSHQVNFNPNTQEVEQQKTAEVKKLPSTAQPQQTKSTAPLKHQTSDSNAHVASTQQKPPIVDKSPASKSSRPRGGSISSLFSIAPEPPRKSSKRNSLIVLSRLQTTSSKDESNNTNDLLGTLKDPYTPPKLELKQPTEVKMETKAAPKHKTEKMLQSSPPSIPYERTSAGARPKMYTSETWSPSSPKWNIKDAVNSAFRRGSVSQGAVVPPTTQNVGDAVIPPPSQQNETQSSLITGDLAREQPVSSTLPTISKPFRIPGEQMEPPAPQSPRVWRPATSSSEEDSHSDAQLTVSPLSTPNTSPPESETEYPHSSSIKKKAHKRNDKSSSPQFLTNARYEPLQLNKNELDSDIDSIQAAARKVMEAFPDTSNYDSGSDRSLTDDSSYLPRTKYQPTKSRASTFDSPIFTPLTPSTPLTPMTPQSPTVFVPKGPRATSSVIEIKTKMHRHNHTSSLDAKAGEPIAKMFVECCACQYYHDMPSKLYEAMANPAAVLNSTENLGHFMGKVSMTVKCPWCKHEMSTKCCAGFAAMVYIKERLH